MSVATAFNYSILLITSDSSVVATYSASGSLNIISLFGWGV